MATSDKKCVCMLTEYTAAMQIEVACSVSHSLLMYSLIHFNKAEANPMPISVLSETPLFV